MNQTEKHALVAYLATKQGNDGNLGKKAAQKYVHILSSISGMDLGYEFSFYTYGPFSRELASDLDILGSSSVIRVVYNSGENSYSISATEKAKDLAELLPSIVKEEADRVWSLFSGRTAKQLELISTILFVHEEENVNMDSADMTERVQSLKPKYSTLEIRSAQKELKAITA